MHEKSMNEESEEKDILTNRIVEIRRKMKEYEELMRKIRDKLERQDKK